MKIYFGFTVAGDRSTIETARGVVRLLEDLGHEVLTRHLVSDNAWEADRMISAQDVYRRDMAWLELCDIFIAEVSGSSFGLGFEAGYLLGATSKKVILLYRRDLEKKVSLLISGNTHPNCILAPYATIAEAEEFVAASLAIESLQ
jgi:nucleoside 2-deoxyribosyltransferase